MDIDDWQGIGTLFIIITAILTVGIIACSLKIEDLQQEIVQLKGFIRDNQVPVMEDNNA